jgi:hypothetical protein
VQLLAGLHGGIRLGRDEDGVSPAVKALRPGQQLPDSFNWSVHEGGRAHAEPHGVSLTPRGGGEGDTTLLKPTERVIEYPRNVFR